MMGPYGLDLVMLSSLPVPDGPLQVCVTGIFGQRCTNSRLTSQQLCLPKVGLNSNSGGHLGENSGQGVSEQIAQHQHNFLHGVNGTTMWSAGSRWTTGGPISIWQVQIKLCGIKPRCGLVQDWSGRYISGQRPPLVDVGEGTSTVKLKVAYHLASSPNWVHESQVMDERAWSEEGGGDRICKLRVTMTETGDE
ncbi:hypothetical protein BDN72DRAFT_124429 [Pluteus cervinus]|uniref:Uncharacterized protein n=1 Tax=Pluteus cervinus TaxID=181527 RepID=A0ACD3B816_9AGAR|nr:hypothetical protein BDN72DRAFT_124429 [Pluteus cervinus]